MTQYTATECVLILERRHCQCGGVAISPAGPYIRVEGDKTATNHKRLLAPEEVDKAIDCNRLPHRVELIDTLGAACQQCFLEHDGVPNANLVWESTLREWHEKHKPEVVNDVKPKVEAYTLDDF